MTYLPPKCFLLISQDSQAVNNSFCKIWRTNKVYYGDLRIENEIAVKKKIIILAFERLFSSIL